MSSAFGGEPGFRVLSIISRMHERKAATTFASSRFIFTSLMRVPQMRVPYFSEWFAPHELIATCALQLASHVDKNSCRYFTPALRSMPIADACELMPRPVCCVKHLSPVFTASGP